MNAPDHDDEERWCDEQRTRVAEYLRSEGVEHGRIGEWPAWHVLPYVSIWAIESRARPEWIGWWVICGDLPTDYISAADIIAPQHPRLALRVIAERWLKQVEAWNDGQEFEGVRIPGPHSNRELAPLLKSRAELLVQWADDDSIWGPD
jgi:hypothetical protein